MVMLGSKGDNNSNSSIPSGGDEQNRVDTPNKGIETSGDDTIKEDDECDDLPF